MKKIFMLFSIMLLLASSSFASKYVKIEPEFLTAAQSKNYETVNQTIAIIFSKIKPVVKTDKYRNITTILLW